MRKLWLLAGTAAFALSAPAMAQQATGLYVSAGVGANWLDRGSYDWDLDGPGDFSLSGDGRTSYDVGPMGVVAVGYDFGMFRAEAELGLRTNDARRTSLDVNSGTDFFGVPLAPGDVDFWDGVAGDVSGDISGHMRTISVMANALVDFDLGPVTIYGGGGLGIANVERYINLAGVVDESSFDTVWAYQGIAGLAYNINPNLAVTGEYRYFDTFETLNHSYAGGDITVRQGSFGNHSALIGLRYTFAAAPAAAAVQDVVQARSYLVFFDFDSSALTTDARSIVASAAQDALAGGSPRLDVTGHTDRSGSDAYNQALSVRRATSVQNELIANGVPADIIVIRGAGERENLVPTADGVREPQNRRVEIVIN